VLSEVNSLSASDFITEFRSHLNHFEGGSVPSVEIEQLFKTAQRLKQEFGLDSTIFLERLTQALFAIPPPLVLSVALLKKAINSSSSSPNQQEQEQRQQQTVLLRTIEGIAGSNPEVMKKVLSLVKTCYDNDLLEEENILKWYYEGTATATGVRASIKKLIEWFQSGEEEE
jgi:hypothetical protein